VSQFDKSNPYHPETPNYLYIPVLLVPPIMQQQQRNASRRMVFFLYPETFIQKKKRKALDLFTSKKLKV
jgi:hypothetical protein